MNRFNSRKPGFFAKTALALALSTALWTATASAAPWHEEPEQPLLDAFFQHYSFCDAMALGAYWSGGDSNDVIYDAKLQGGYKVANFGPNDVWQYHLQPKLASFDGTVPRGYSWAGCYYDNSDFDYDDAETVACLWQQTEGSQISIDDAKLVIGLGVGMREDVRGALDHAITQLDCPGAVG